MALRAHGLGIAFDVEGPPPLKSGAVSMWRNAEQIERLKRLRTRAAEAIRGRRPFDEPVRLAIRIRALESEADEARRVRRDRFPGPRPYAKVPTALSREGNRVALRR